MNKIILDNKRTMLITAIETNDWRRECLYWWWAVETSSRQIRKVVYHILDPKQSLIIKEGTLEQVNIILDNLLK